MTQKVVRLTWEDIQTYCEKLVYQLKQRKFTPDLIITAVKGGFVPSAIISHKLGIRNVFAIPSQKSLDDRIYTGGKKSEIKFFIPEIEIKNKKVLLLDDIFASGDTMHEIFSKTRECHPEQIVTASLIVNINRSREYNAILPDICFKKVTDWIIFPWESN